MTDMVRVATGTRYEYENFLDFLAQLHLKTSIADICEKYYNCYDPTNKIKGRAFATTVLYKELATYVVSYYDGSENNNIATHISYLIDSMYETNGTIRTLFSSTLNKMREEGVSIDKIKEIQEFLRVIIVL